MKTKFNKSAQFELKHIDTGETFRVKLSGKQACNLLKKMDYKAWNLEQR